MKPAVQLNTYLCVLYKNAHIQYKPLLLPVKVDCHSHDSGGKEADLCIQTCSVLGDSWVTSLHDLETNQLKVHLEHLTLSKKNNNNLFQIPHS